MKKFRKGKPCISLDLTRWGGLYKGVLTKRVWTVVSRHADGRVTVKTGRYLFERVKPRVKKYGGYEYFDVGNGQIGRHRVIPKGG
jgi:hypothetical protein